MNWLLRQNHHWPAMISGWIILILALPMNGQESSSGNAIPIKVMSFNIRYGKANDGDNRWENRSLLVAETIEMFGPDLLGTQEVLRFQADFLKDKFPEYGFHGVGREDGKQAGEFVPVMFKTKRFELLDAGHFWLSETPGKAGSKSWDSSLPRMVSWVELSDRSNGDAKFVFLNTHFDHRGKTARLESARLIRKRCEQFMDRGLPLVITGDFNTNEDRKPYALLVNGEEGNQTPIFDSYRQANPERSENESTSSRWNGNRKGFRIDWVLHSREFRTLRSTINYTNDQGRYPSDHYPAQAIIRLQR